MNYLAMLRPRASALLVTIITALLIAAIAGCGGARKDAPGSSANPDTTHAGGDAPAVDREAPTPHDSTPPVATDTAKPAPAGTGADTGSAGSGDVTTGNASPADAERAIAGRASAVLAALKGKDMEALAALVDPGKGVRLSPYPHVSDEDLVLKREDLPLRWKNGKTYTWGSHDGSGDPITLTFPAYYKRFIFDHDFSQAKKVAYNGELLGHGNTINNLHEFYPRGIVVEYHFPGFDRKYEGMDWRSLWLVFERSGAEWYLVEIAHGEWTI